MDNQTFINRLKDSIYIEQRGYFIFKVDITSDDYESFNRAFGVAVGILNAVVNIRHKIIIFISDKPAFETNLSTNGKLRYMPSQNPEEIGTCLESFIFINCKKTISYQFDIQVAIILEEFVHCVMNIKDETVASKIVTFLWPRVNFINGKYDIIHK